jgi:hypothetical protein
MLPPFSLYKIVVNIETSEEFIFSGHCVGYYLTVGDDDDFFPAGTMSIRSDIRRICEMTDCSMNNVVSLPEIAGASSITETFWKYLLKNLKLVQGDSINMNFSVAPHEVAIEKCFVEFVMSYESKWGR